MLSVESLLAYGPLGLFIVAFTESTVFPIPPDVILLPLAMMSPRLSWWYAFLTSSASVLGALVGYAVGRKAGRPVLRRFFKEETIGQVETLFVKYGGWAVGIAAFTPLPFKIFTFGAGIFRVPLVTFTVVSTVGRSARFFLEGAMVYFLGDRAQAYLGRNFELATLGVTAALLLATWLLPKVIPSGKKPVGAPESPAPEPPRWKSVYRNAVMKVHGLGTRSLAWGMAALVLAFFSLVFAEDVAGPERGALNAALGPVFGWLRPGEPTIAWKIISSPWAMGALGVFGLTSYLRPLKDRLWGERAAGRGPLGTAAAILAALIAVGTCVDVLVRWRIAGVFAPAQLLTPYLAATGVYLMDYRGSSRRGKAAGTLLAAAPAAAMSLKSVADGLLDPACAALSLLSSGFMFCLSMAALTAPTFWSQHPR
ncbi:MAG: YqaA family protein [Bacillota bacterium]